MVNLTKEQQAQCDKVMSKISLAKDKAALEGHVVNLSKCMVDLSKKSQVNLCNRTARVIVVLDYSGSMSQLYNDGTIQKTLNRLVPLGLSFDDNGELDVYLFQNTHRKLQSLTLSNYENYKTSVIDKSGYYMGGTNYAPVIKAILEDEGKISEKKTSIFGGTKVKTANSGDDVFVLFITDGAPGDSKDSDTVIKLSSQTNTFIQFIGIGSRSDEFRYLQHLDDLPGRPIDNTGFSNLTSLSSISDDDLYVMVLEQFAQWLKARGIH